MTMTPNIKNNHTAGHCRSDAEALCSEILALLETHQHNNNTNTSNTNPTSGVDRFSTRSIQNGIPEELANSSQQPQPNSSKASIRKKSSFDHHHGISSTTAHRIYSHLMELLVTTTTSASASASAAAAAPTDNNTTTHENEANKEANTTNANTNTNANSSYYASNDVLYNAKVLQPILLQCVLPLKQKYPDHVQRWMDNYLAKPLLGFLVDVQDPTLLKKTRGKMVVPVGIFPLLALSITRRQELQDIVNAYSIQRNVLRFIFVELFAQVTIIALFMIISNDYLNDVRDFEGGEITQVDIGSEGSNSHYWAGLFTMIGFISIRHLISIFSMGPGQWLLTGFNVLFVTEFALLVTSSVWMESGKSNYDEEFSANRPYNPNEYNAFEDVRLMIVLTGGLNIINLILMLRNTFLPFATFVNGTIHIIGILFPFITVVILILFAFMFMYYVQRYDDGLVCDYNRTVDVCYCDDSTGNNFCTYGQSFQQVFGYIVAQAPDATDFLDYFCGVLIAIIFLNVVIAIVEQAWDEASTNKINQAFWQYRLEFFSEIRICRNWTNFSCLHWLEDKIDSLGEGPDPFDEYWLASCKEKRTAWDRLRNFLTLARHVALKWLICFPLGLVTFGFFWPTDLRDFLFTNRHEVPKVMSNDDDYNNHDIQTLQGEIIKLQAALEVANERAQILEEERNRAIGDKILCQVILENLQKEHATVKNKLDERQATIENLTIENVRIEQERQSVDATTKQEKEDLVQENQRLEMELKETKLLLNDIGAIKDAILQLNKRT